MLSLQETRGPTNRLLWPRVSKRHGLPCGCAPGDIGNTHQGGKFIHVRSQQIHLEMKHLWVITYNMYDYIIIYTWNILEPVFCLGAKNKTSKRRLKLQSKQGSFGFQVYVHQSGQGAFRRQTGMIFQLRPLPETVAIWIKKLIINKNTGILLRPNANLPWTFMSEKNWESEQFCTKDIGHQDILV